MPEMPRAGRRSQTEIAVLGGLSIQSMTGYALREAIRDVLGHFWSESFGQIYPTLSALTEQGLIVARPGSRPSSSVFEITSAGRQRLHELLREPFDAAPPRDGLLLRLFFGRSLGVAYCRDLLVTTRAQAQVALAEYEELARTLTVTEAGSPDLPFTLVTVAAGRHSAAARIAWADEALALLPDETRR